MVREIDALRQEAITAIGAAADLKSLEELRVRFAGRRSRLREILSSIGKLSTEERPIIGQAAGKAQREIDSALEQRQSALEALCETSDAFDITLPGRRPHRGRKHPLTAMTDELVDVLRSMGFSVADGPEVDDEFHNFDALNTPADHPARDEHDTFYLDDGHL